MTFGEILRNLIDNCDITQKKLASDLNIAPSTLGNYIQNSREPDFETLKKLADYFNVSVDYLINHKSAKADSILENELITVFRTLTPEQQKMFVEQEKSIMKYNSRIKSKK